MNKILILLSCLLCACDGDNTQTPQQQTNDFVVVGLTVYTSEPDKITRTTDENAIADLNLYLVDNLTMKSLHIYTRTPSVQFSCHPGTYRLYVIANAHADMGNLTYEQVVNFSVAHDSAPGDLVMTAQKDLTLGSSEQSVELAPLEVKRFAAKINYNITVDASYPDIEIKSVQFMRLPERAMPFAAGQPAAYTDGPICANSGITSAFSGTVFMLPNCQGTVAGIVSQEQKTPQNAPTNATYLRIRAMRGVKILDYIVYLGRNNTDNFDVAANTAHTLHIAIRGDNETDVRIRSYTVDVQSRIDAETHANICTSTGPITLTINMGGLYRDMGLHAKIKLKSGDPELFIFDSQVPKPIYSISNLNQSSTFPINYEPLEFKRYNMLLDFTVSIYDRFGWVADYDFSYIYAYMFKVYTEWFDGGKAGGTIISDDATSVVEEHTLSAVYYTIFCPKEGCILTAVPKAGKIFDGWWRGYNHTGVISYEPVYQFVPAPFDNRIIYAFFR